MRQEAFFLQECLFALVLLVSLFPVKSFFAAPDLASRAADGFRVPSLVLPGLSAPVATAPDVECDECSSLKGTDCCEKRRVELSFDVRKHGAPLSNFELAELNDLQNADEEEQGGASRPTEPPVVLPVMPKAASANSALRMADLLSRSAQKLERHGEWKQAVVKFQSALSVLQKWLDSGDGDQIEALRSAASLIASNIGNALEHTGNLQEAGAMYQYALSIASNAVAKLEAEKRWARVSEHTEMISRLTQQKQSQAHWRKLIHVASLP